MSASTIMADSGPQSYGAVNRPKLVVTAEGKKLDERLDQHEKCVPEVLPIVLLLVLIEAL